MTIFILLFLVSSSCLIVGLMRPDLALKVLKRKNITRIEIGFVLGTATFVFLLLIGVTTPAQDSKHEPSLFTQTQTKPATEEKIETRTEVIPFPLINEDNPALAKGLTNLKQAGKDGSREIRTKVIYVDGKETRRELLPAVVIIQPVAQITSVGTYVLPGLPLTPIQDSDSPDDPQPDCDPNYSPCVPIASDVDCAGGSGDGPEYVAGPVTVIGYDKYDLDGDGDGVGCE